MIKAQDGVVCMSVTPDVMLHHTTSPSQPGLHGSMTSRHGDDVTRPQWRHVSALTWRYCDDVTRPHWRHVIVLTSRQCADVKRVEKRHVTVWRWRQISARPPCYHNDVIYSRLHIIATSYNRADVTLPHLRHALDVPYAHASRIDYDVILRLWRYTMTS